MRDRDLVAPVSVVGVLDDADEVRIPGELAAEAGQVAADLLRDQGRRAPAEEPLKGGSGGAVRVGNRRGRDDLNPAGAHLVDGALLRGVGDRQDRLNGKMRWRISRYGTDVPRR